MFPRISGYNSAEAGTELGVVERAIHCAAAITGRLRIEPEPLTEHRRDVNMLEICIGFGPLWKGVAWSGKRIPTVRRLHVGD
jgi:hypothetical protein